MTCDQNPKKIREVAKDWLMLCGALYPHNREIIPAASAVQDGEELVEISPTLALKFILRNVMTERQLSKRALASLLGTSRKSVKKLLDVYDEDTRFDDLFRALAVCGADEEVSA